VKKSTVLDKQSVKRHKRKNVMPRKQFFGQLGYGFIKIFFFFIGLGALSLAFIAGYQFLSSSSYFQLHHIVIAGVGDDFREELINISGITEEQNLLSIESSKVRENIESHPWIKSVFIRKDFPHTIYIRTEHEQAAAVVAGDKLYLMNRDGMIFKEVEGNDCVDYPVITGLSQDKEIHEAILRRVASFLRTVQLCAPTGLEKDLSEIHVEKDGAFSVYFNDLPFKVLFGKDDFERKIDSLRDVVRHLQMANQLDQTTSIDLDYHDRAVVAFSNRVI
jgi:cell division protein FtsQ